jgi:hypothetical protein
VTICTRRRDRRNSAGAQRASAHEIEDARRAEAQARSQLDGVERNPDRQRIGETDPSGPQRDGNRPARDAEIPGRHRQESGQLDRRNDHQCGGDGRADTECRGDGSHGGESRRDRRRCPHRRIGAGARRAAEGAERIEDV